MALSLFQLPTLLSFLPSLFFPLVIASETHTVKFDNQCGYGTPQLIQGSDVLTTTEYTFDGSYSGIAYLQTGDCGFNGENCGTIEMTLINPTVSGGGSSADISYIPPLEFSVPYKFEYYGGCDGQGASCSSSDCSEAFYNPDETYVQVACQTDNVNLLITFCHGGNSENGTAATTSYSESVAQTTSETDSTFSTQIANTAASSPTASVDGDGAAMSVASSTVSAPFSISSSRRCRNRKRGNGRGLPSRAHRRRTRFFKLS